MCALTFHGINEGGFGGYELTDQLLYNIKWWIDHNMLRNGAYGIYEYDSSSWYSDDETKLRLVSDERFEYGKVWESPTREYVWESGVSLGSGALTHFESRAC